MDRDGSLTGSEPFTKVVPYSGVMDTSVCPVEHFYPVLFSNQVLKSQTFLF